MIKQGPEGAVSLERLPSRGTTVRYSGALKSFQASHPMSLSPQVLEKALGGIHVGIAPTDRDGTSQGIKPTPLFSHQEAAFLAPAIAAALERAEPDQLVAFQVGSEADRSDGTLYVDGATIQLALSHYHSAAGRRDGNLSIYILSMKPEQAQVRPSGPRTGLTIEPDQPRLAINYTVLQSLTPVEAVPAGPARSTESAATRNSRSLKEVVDQQAQELESLKSELEALKQQLQTQGTSPRPKPAP